MLPLPPIFIGLPGVANPTIVTLRPIIHIHRSNLTSPILGLSAITFSAQPYQSSATIPQDHINEATQTVFDPHLQALQSAHQANDSVAFFAAAKAAGLEANNATLDRILQRYPGHETARSLILGALAREAPDALDHLLGSCDSDRLLKFYLEPSFFLNRMPDSGDHYACTLPLAAMALQKVGHLQTIFQRMPEIARRFPLIDHRGATIPLLSWATCFGNRELIQTVVQAFPNRDMYVLNPKNAQQSALSHVLTALSDSLERFFNYIESSDNYISQEDAYNHLLFGIGGEQFQQPGQQAVVGRLRELIANWQAFYEFCPNKAQLLNMLIIDTPGVAEVDKHAILRLLFHYLKTEIESLVPKKAWCSNPHFLRIVFSSKSERELEDLYQTNHFLHFAATESSLAVNVVMRYCPESCKAGLTQPDEAGNRPLYHALLEQKLDVAALLMRDCGQATEPSLSNALVTARKELREAFATASFRSLVAFIKACPKPALRDFFKGEPGVSHSILKVILNRKDADSKPAEDILKLLRIVFRVYRGSNTADLYTSASSSRSLIHSACGIDQLPLEVMRFLLDKCPNIDAEFAPDQEGATPMHALSCTLNFDLLYLIYITCPSAQRSRLFAPDANGKTPICLAMPNTAAMRNEIVRLARLQRIDPLPHLAPITPIPLQNVSGRLYRGSLPVDTQNVQDRIDAYRQWGFQDIVLLCKPREYAEMNLLENYRTHFAVTHFPISNGGLPRSESDFLQFLSTLHAKLTAGRNVLVHCEKGRGRTGLVLAALACRMFAWRPEQAIAWIQGILPGALRSTMQQGYLDVIFPPPTEPPVAEAMQIEEEASEVGQRRSRDEFEGPDPEGGVETKRIRTL